MLFAEPELDEAERTRAILGADALAGSLHDLGSMG
jgi:hypothetical protein